MNKIAKQNMGMTLGVIALVVIAASFAFTTFFKTTSQSVLGDNSKSGVGYISTGATTLSLNSIDAIQKGTAVGGASYISVNGAVPTTGITTASPNDKLDILFVNGSAYHAGVVLGHTVATSPTDVITVQSKKNASVAITMFNTNNAVIDGGANNQTMSTGSSANIAIRLDGQDKTSTQDMVCILEASDNSKVDKMTLSLPGAVYSGMVKPSSYTLAGATSQIWVYEVAPIEGAVSVNGVIGVTSKTAQDASGTYGKITCRTKENFVDSATGKITYGIEDSLGVAKSIASYTATVNFQ